MRRVDAGVPIIERGPARPLWMPVISHIGPDPRTQKKRRAVSVSAQINPKQIDSMIEEGDKEPS
jgi:hypothetical protein